MLERDYRSPDYEYPIPEISRSASVGQAAGVYWLNGTTVIAAYDSAAEDRLLDDGAVLIATLSFEADSLERVHGAGCFERVDRVTAVRAARELLSSGVN